MPLLKRSTGGGGGSQTLAQTLALGADAGANRITNVGQPTADQDAATKKYVDIRNIVQVAGATYTLSLADLDDTVEFTNATGIVVTIPPNSAVAFPIGTQIPLVQMGAGPLSITPGAGVTLDAVGGSLLAAGRYSTILATKRATDEWVISGEVEAPRIKGDRELQLAPLGLVSASFLPAEVAANSSPASQSLYAMRVPLRKGMAITALQFLVGVAAVGAAPTGIYVGIADSTGKVLVQSGNTNATLWTALGFLNIPLGSTFTVPSDGSYFAFILVNGTWATTQPQLQRLGGTMIDDTRVDARQGALTVPPANNANLTLVATAILHFWVGCVGS